MAVKIRLARRGRKKAPIYDIVVADARSPRDGRFIEKLGQYNPHATPAVIVLDNERALHWMMVGAQPTDTARKILSVKGIMLRKHLQVGVNKGAITQEVADARFESWSTEKQSLRETKLAKLAGDKDSVKKAALEAEKKKKESMEEAKAKAEADAIAAVEAAKAAEEAANAPAEEVAVVEEAAAEETEAPAAEDATPEAAAE